MGAYEVFYRLARYDDEEGAVIETPPAREPFRLLIDDDARRQVIADMLGRYGASRRKENFGSEDGEEELSSELVVTQEVTHA